MIRGWRRLVDHAKLPLLRDGYALALNSGVTAVVGLVYWIVAAHVYSPRVVGINSAIISAMIFVAGVATLNLSNVLVRFLPEAGDNRRRLVLASYAVTTATAAALTACLTVGWIQLPQRLRFFETSVGLAPAFALATAAWCIFVLQDGVLTGIGRAVLVPVENGIFAVGKLLLLVVFATAMPTYGIFASWTLGMMLTVVGVNAVLLMRLLPSGRCRATTPSLVRSRAFAEYFAMDWACSIGWLAGTTLLPVVVTGVAGPATNATFALAWAVAFPLYAVAASIGTALVVHGASNPAELHELARRSARQGAVLLAAAVAVLVIAAPYALRLFGSEYAAGGATLLRLLALGALPNLVVALWVSQARVRRRLRGPAAILCGQAVLTLALVTPFLRAFGATGAGLAWLVGQTVVAGGILVVGRWKVRPRRGDARIARGLLGPVALRRIGTDSDISIVSTASRQLVKLGTSTSAKARLAAHADAVAGLRALPGLEAWRDLLPEITQAGDTWLVERVLPGVDGRRMPPERVLRATAEAMEPLYRLTAGRESDGVLTEWVRSRVSALERVSGTGGRAVVERLHADVAGRVTRTGWVHGDLWPGNVLLAPDGSAVTGLVDWESSRRNDVPIADLGHLLVCTRALATGRSLGSVVRRLADGRDELTALEWRIVRSVSEDPLSAATIARLGWLQHVSVRLAQVDAHPKGLWVHRTVRPVLGGVHL